MSDVQLGIKITADGSKAVASLNQVAGATKGVGSSNSYASSELKRMTTDLMRQSDAARQSARAMADAKAAAKAAASSFSGLGTAIGLVTSVMSGRELYGIIAEYDRLNASLKTVTGSTQTAVAVMDGLKQFARETPYELAQVTEAFIRMRSMGLDASMDAMRSMGNTASAMGKPLMQFIEAVADASTNEFERLKEFGIKAKQEGDQVTFTFQGVETTVQKSSTAIQEYLLQLGRTKFAGGMVDQMNTVDGAISNVKDSFSQLVDTIGNLGVRDALKKGFAGVTEFLDQLRQDIESVHSMGQSGTKANLENQIAMYRNIVGRLTSGGADVTIGIGSTEAAMGRSKALEDAKTKLAELEKQLATINGEIVKSTEAAKSAAVTSVAGVANSATTALRGLNAEQQRVANQIIEAAKAAKLDPALALSVAQTESRFRQSARSPVGAMGVMQLMPDTARGLGVNPANEQENIQGGIKYLKQLQGEFKTLTQIAAGYNAGPGNVRNDKWMRFAETRDYVQKVTAAYQQFKAELKLDDGFNVAREQFDSLRNATQRYIANLDDQAKAAQRQAEVAISGIDNQISALDRERDAWDKAQQDKLDAAKGSYDAMARLEAERAAKLQDYAARELTLIQQQYDARKQAMEADASAFRKQLTNPNLTDEEERRAKQGLADIQADLVKLANERAQAEAKAGQAAMDANRGGLELAQKQRDFIAGINADLEFQKQLYLQLKAAKEAGASTEGLAILRATAERSGQLPGAVSQAEIQRTEQAIAQTKIYEQEIANLTQSAQDRAESVREQQLRENAYWDQLMGRTESLANLWTDIYGAQAAGLSNLTVAMARYSKDVAQIKTTWSDQKVKDQWGDLAGLMEGLQSAQAGAVALSETMLAIRSTTQQGTKAYEDLTTAAGNFAIMGQWLNVVEGIGAVIHQLRDGDVYTAIPRALGVAAMVASMGVQTGVIGGAGTQNATAKYSDGTNDGVFGDSTAASESITKSLEIIRDNSSNDLNYSAAMLRALEGIEAAMSGVTNTIIRGVQPASVKSGRLSGLGDLDVGGIDPLGRMIGNLIFSTYRRISDFGIQASQQALSAIIKGGFSGQVYTDIETTTKVLGMTVSKSVKTVFEGLDPAIAKQFTLAFQSISTAIVEGGKAFGLTAEDFAQRMRGFIVDMGKISTKDMTGEELQKKITQMFSEQSDRMARRFMPGLGKFQQVGEGYFQTFIRVAEAVNRAGGELERLGIKAISYRNIERKQADIAAEIVRESLLQQTGLADGVRQYVKELTGSAEDLIDAYKKLREATQGLRTAGLGTNVTRAEINAGGGLDAYTQNLQTYLDKFLTPDERLIGGWQNIGDAFTAIGLKMPTTNAEFRKLVEGIDTSTEAGQKLRGAVLALAPGFADLASAMDDAKSALQSAYDTAKQQAQGLRDYLNSLKTGDASTGTGLDRYNAAKKIYQETLAKAQAGDKNAIDALQGVSSTFLELSKKYFAASGQYGSDLASVQTGLGTLAGAIENDIKTAEDNHTWLKDNTKALDGLAKAMRDYETTLAKVNGIQSSQAGGNQSIDAINSGNNTQALREQAAQAYENQLNTLQDELKAAQDAGNRQKAKDIKASIDWLLSEIASSARNLEAINIGKGGRDRFARWDVRLRAMGGYTPPGWAVVGERGPELVNFTRPSRVYTASETRAALSDSPALLDRIENAAKAGIKVDQAGYQALLAELQAIRAEMAEQTRAQKMAAVA